MSITEQISNFIKEVESKGAVKGANFNSIVLPTNILDQFEEEINTMLKIEDSGCDKIVFQGLEVLVSGENATIRVALVY